MVPPIEVRLQRPPGQLPNVRVSGITGWEGWAFNVTVREQASGVPDVVAVEVVAPEGVALTPSAFRRVPIGSVIRQAEGAFHNPLMAMVAERLGVEVGPRPYGGGLDHLCAVASLYRMALSQGIPPREGVAEVYGVTTKTVSRWLAEARSTTDPATGAPLLGDYQAELEKHGVPSETQKKLRKQRKEMSERE